MFVIASPPSPSKYVRCTSIPVPRAAIASAFKTRSRRKSPAGRELEQARHLRTRLDAAKIRSLEELRYDLRDSTSVSVFGYDFETGHLSKSVVS